MSNNSDSPSDSSNESSNSHAITNRFRGFLPVVIDVETGGFNAKTDALLEIAAVIIGMERNGKVYPKETYHCNVYPFEGSNIERSAIEFTGIDPYNPLRGAMQEKDALQQILSPIRKEVREQYCNRAILVGHNASFDHGFLFAAAERVDFKRNPFHPFSSFDTSTLAGLAYGQTVLAKACEMAGIKFSNKEAHSAKYDTEKTAELFCKIVNKWSDLGGWPL